MRPSLSLAAALLLGPLALPSLARAEPVARVAPDRTALQMQDTFRKIAQAIRPAVVRINVVESVEAPEMFMEDPSELFRQFFGQGGKPPTTKQRLEGVGSGVIVDPKGYILTNEHVVGEAEEITVTVQYPDTRRYRGRVVGKDKMSDLAVVRIRPDRELAYATLGDSSKSAVGDWAIAVGSPFGLEQTLTVGVISAMRQSPVEVEGHTYNDFIQTDAAINRGNSGGPLLNIYGEVIGINTAILAPAGGFVGVGFAIPSNDAAEIMKQLIATGHVVRGWLGAEILPLDEVLARQFKTGSRKGALVNRVIEGSPAAKAGLRRGDVVVAFDGKPIETPTDLIHRVSALKPGSRATLGILREGRRQDLQFVAGERPAEVKEGGTEAPAQEETEKSWEGATLKTATPDLNQEAGLPADARGVVVTAVSAGVAADIGLEPGDMIVDVDQKPTPDVRSFLRAVAPQALSRGVVLDVNRKGHLLYLSYRKPS